MVSKIIKSVRCEDVLKSFMSSSHGCVFLTLTTPDVVDIYEIRKRWRDLRHFLSEKFKGIKYVMNFEIHPKGHGWHIHSVWNRYIPLTNSLISKFHEFGFGRFDIRRVNSKGVADYLTKHALKAYRGVSQSEMKRNPSFRLRLVNASRGLPVLSDYEWRSDFKTDLKSLLKRYKLNPSKRPVSFRHLYSLMEVCSLLKFSSVSQLYSYLIRLRRDSILRKGQQIFFDLPT